MCIYKGSPIAIFGASCQGSSLHVVSLPSRSRLNRNLERRPALHFIQGSLIVFQFEHIRHHPLHIDLSTIKVGNRTGKTIRLRKRADNLNNSSKGKGHVEVRDPETPTRISSPNIFDGGQWTRALFS